MNVAARLILSCFAARVRRACRRAPRSRRRRRPSRAAGERARPAVPAVQGQRRGQPQAQPAAGAVPRRPALRRPARRPLQRRPLSRRRRRRPSTTSPRSTRSRATSSTRPTSSPTTCSNIRPRTRCAGFSRTCCALTEALPMNHFFGLHTLYPTFASGQGGGAVQDASPTMRTT